ncbi:MAG TPA: hypothetical protein VFG23_00235 [Polyangia bacterium]|nr:hypothetical protein [Polyangia bacterium]
MSGLSQTGGARRKGDDAASLIGVGTPENRASIDELAGGGRDRVARDRTAARVFGVAADQTAGDLDDVVQLRKRTAFKIGGKKEVFDLVMIAGESSALEGSSFDRELELLVAEVVLGTRCLANDADEADKGIVTTS